MKKFLILCIVLFVSGILYKYPEYLKKPFGLHIESNKNLIQGKAG